MVEYRIITYKNEEGTFAEIQTTSGKQICIADGEFEHDAIKEVCLVFADILDDFIKDNKKDA